MFSDVKSKFSTSRGLWKILGGQKPQNFRTCINFSLITQKRRMLRKVPLCTKLKETKLPVDQIKEKKEKSKIGSIGKFLQPIKKWRFFPILVKITITPFSKCCSFTMSIPIAYLPPWKLYSINQRVQKTQKIWNWLGFWIFRYCFTSTKLFPGDWTIYSTAEHILKWLTMLLRSYLQ